MKRVIKALVCVCIIVFVTCIGVVGIKQKENKIEQNAITTSSTMNLSNKKIGWGIKRADNHAQPDLGSKNKEIIDKYKGIAMGNADDDVKKKANYIAMGNANDKYVYLTFDEGYEAGYTPRILQVLKDNNVKACFFLTAHFVNTEEGLVKQMIQEGHAIGNHIPVILMTVF